MRIKTLHVENFRNYAEADISFDPGVNVFLGMNAQGKTNLLEALYILSSGKSYRASKDTELIKWKETFFRIKGEVERNDFNVSLEVSFSQKGRKLVRLNGTEAVRPSKLASFLNVVMFTPEDLSLVKGAPLGRRRFLDDEISQVSPIYRSFLNSYNKILIQRNAILRNYNTSSYALLEVWSDQLIDVGSKIMMKRAEYLKSLGVIARMTHRKITGSKEELTLRYIPSFACEAISSVEEVKKHFAKTVENKKEIELIRRVTLVGPHRDDIKFDVDGIDVGKYGSQGQQRSVVLSLKIAEVNYIKTTLGEDPILLLDDVLSELDDVRRDHLVREAVEKHQTMITSADMDCLKFLPQSAKVYQVTAGSVKVLNGDRC